MRLLVDLSSIPLKDNLDTGLTRYATRLLKGFAEEGQTDITLLVPSAKEDLFKSTFPSFKTIGFKRHKRIPVLSKPFPRHFLDSFKWRRTINDSGCDLVFRPFLGTQFDFWRLRVPFVLTVHDLQLYKTTTFFNSFISKYFLFPRIVRQAEKIIAISDFVKKDIISFFRGVPENKVTVIHNGVVYPEDNENLLFPIKDKPFILTVNTLVPYKNVITLVKAFNLIKDEIPHDLVIVGRESVYWKKVLYKYIQQNQLEDRVKRVGPISDSDLWGLYRKAGLFVSTSLLEGFGYTPVEAGIAGTKVLSTTETALPESTMGLVNYYEPATDPKVLATRIIETLEKDDLKERENISESFKKEYDHKARAADVYSLLKEVYESAVFNRE